MPLNVLAPLNVLLLARSVVEETVMEPPAVNALPLMVPRVPVRRLVPIEVEAMTKPAPLVERREFVMPEKMRLEVVAVPETVRPPDAVPLPIVVDA